MKKSKYPKRMFFENYEYIPKQQLISWLEDKTKQTGTGIHNRALDFNCGLRQGKIEAFSEVLDFVDKDGHGETN